MTAAERVLAHFDRISEAPDAIPRLRRFVLDLAVRGKLVEQDPNQAHWTSRTLGDLGVWGSGGTPLKTHPEYYGGDIPWLVIGDLNDSVVTRAKTSITAAGLENSSTRLVEPGTILIALYGSIGKLGIAGIRCATNQAIAFCVPDTNAVSRDYLFLTLRSMREDLLSRGQGVAQQNISQKILKARHVRVPPLPEQARIVAKVGELMALCDRLEAAQNQRESRRKRLVNGSLARLNQAADPVACREHARFHLAHLPRMTASREHSQRLRQTILNLAVRGKMVPRTSEGEPEGMFVGCDDGRPDIPVTWRYARLAELLSEDTRNGYSQRPDDEPTGTPILRISAATTRRDGIVAEEEHKLISGIDSAVRAQYGLRRGDLLACRFNGNKSFVGRLAMFADNLGIEPIYPDKLIRVRVNSSLAVPAFICLAGATDLVRQDIEAACATTVGNWGISASNLKGVRFPLPPLAEQKRIVAKVDELMAICDRLEAQIDIVDKQNRALLESLLHEALLNPVGLEPAAV